MIVEGKERWALDPDTSSRKIKLNPGSISCVRCTLVAGSLCMKSGEKAWFAIENPVSKQRFCNALGHPDKIARCDGKRVFEYFDRNGKSNGQT